MWISSPLGVMRAPVSGKGDWRLYSVDEGLPVKGTGPIVVDGTGGAWVGAGQGLARISEDSVEVLFLPPGESPLKPLYVSSLWLSRDGTLWIGTTQGLLSLRDGQFTRYGPEQGMPRAAAREGRPFVHRLRAPSAAASCWAATAAQDAPRYPIVDAGGGGVRPNAERPTNSRRGSSRTSTVDSLSCCRKCRRIAQRTSPMSVMWFSQLQASASVAAKQGGHRSARGGCEDPSS